MRTRHALALVGSLSLLAGCSQSHGATGDGVCCPVTDFTGCSPGSEPLPGGGWAPSLGECTYTIEGYDGPPFVRVTDERGCARVEEDDTAVWCGTVPPPLDAGTGPVDAGPVDAGRDAMATGCDGLGPAACLTAGCVPSFDDACCPTCTDGPCADCVNYTYFTCRTYADGCMAAFCSQTPAWMCSGAADDCSAAHPTDVDSCDIAGCVPAYPSGTGEPDPLTATCVSIHRDICTVACRRIAPDCPERTFPEGDGFCYTDRCIPAFVCE